MAGSNNVVSAQMFYSAGSTGLQILQQIYIADTSDHFNRALVSSLPDILFLITVWVGAPIASSLMEHTTWRWGYGIWTIVLPVVFLLLALTLFLDMRNAAKLHFLLQSPWQGQTFLGGTGNIWYEIDVMGLLLLSAAVSLILIPLTSAAKAKSGWHMECQCYRHAGRWLRMPSRFSLVGSPLGNLPRTHIFHLDFSPTVPEVRYSQAAPLAFSTSVSSPCSPYNAPTSSTHHYSSPLAVFYTSIQPYFYSYLQVVQNDSAIAAGHITQTFTFTSTVAAIITSIIIKYTRHYKYFITAGAAIYLLGIVS